MIYSGKYILKCPLPDVLILILMSSWKESWKENVKNWIAQEWRMFFPLKKEIYCVLKIEFLVVINF